MSLRETASHSRGIDVSNWTALVKIKARTGMKRGTDEGNDEVIVGMSLRSSPSMMELDEDLRPEDDVDMDWAGVCVGL
jgi:hypothetical protein